MSVLRYCCFRWLVYDRALAFEPSRPLACIMMLVWLIYVLELCCDIFPWVSDLDCTCLRAWLVYDWIRGVTARNPTEEIESWGEKCANLCRVYKLIMISRVPVMDILSMWYLNYWFDLITLLINMWVVIIISGLSWRNLLNIFNQLGS